MEKAKNVLKEKLYGEKVILHPANLAFAENVAEYYARNRSFLKEFEPCHKEEFFTADGQKTLLEREISLMTQDRGYRFYITSLENPSSVIGTIALSNIVRGAFQSCHLGYKLDKEHLCRGYMTEAVKIITCFAFLNLKLHRIEANVMPENIPSRRVLEKNGYVNEGLSPKYLNINGKWEDHIHMVKINDEWTAQS